MSFVKSTNSESDEETTFIPLVYNAKCVLLTRDEGGYWDMSSETVSCKEDFESFFGENVTQVNLSKYFKVYYDSRAFEDGVSGRCTDMMGEEFFLSDRLLFVLCDDEKPIDMTEEALEEMKKLVIFY